MPQKPKSFLAVFTERGPLTALVVAVGLLFGIAAPASAQFFNFGGPPQQQPRQQPRNSGFGWFGGGGDSPFFAPFQRQQPQAQPQSSSQAPRRREDFSRAPAPEKRDNAATPERNVLVLGDAMADWLAYGLEDAYSEQPDMGVIRKHKTVSGLLRYQPKGEPADWAAAAKGILATEKPDAIVVMLGLDDRVSIKEPDKKDAKKDDKVKPADNGAADAAKPADKPDDEDPDNVEPEKATRSANGVADFHDDRWAELYTRKIEGMISVLKSKGVPVLWVGLPAVRGTRATADMLFLDSLYRDAAGKAGITYVDVWDGFVDESGRFLQRGPDFEGQPRKLRSDDGVYFTKAGARKLAHYVEREITRLLAGRAAPIAIPSEPATPDANVVPGAPPPRPLAGPIIPLVASSMNSEQLLGAPGARAGAVDALVTRTMVKGEPLSAPAGRADDFAWPRREVGHEQARGETPVASVNPAGTPATTRADSITPVVAPPAPPAPPKPKRPRPAVAAEPGFGSFFGLDTPARQPQAPQRPRNIVPRPPADVGPSASAPGFFAR